MEVSAELEVRLIEVSLQSSYVQIVLNVLFVFFLRNSMP